MLESFKTYYDSLNERQKQAVDAIEGPVMVIAGPGTGKTQILAVRILNILKTTGARPQEILCLTYTDTGAVAMRNRLSSFIGAEAYKVNIHTFHGLCNRIIQENPELFSRGNLRVMDKLDELELLDQIIRDLPAGSPLKNYSENPAWLRNSLTTVFNLIQSENYTASYLRQHIDKLKNHSDFKLAFPDLVYTKNGVWGNAGDVKLKEFNNYHLDWEKLLAAAELYDEYQKRKAKAGLYEFSDMINWVLTALNTNQDLLYSYQEKFQYLLVDEYQDTSGVQNQILYKLIDFWEDNPNCFVVGDDDQSIYAFQGARVSNMTEFAWKHQKHLKTIVLTNNYRSTQDILDTSAKLINHNQDRLVNKLNNLSKDLQAAGKNKLYEKKPVTFAPYRNRFHEAAGTLNALKELNRMGADWKEMAVIYSKHAIGDELLALMVSEKIPFSLTRNVNILKEPLIKQLHTWLQYLSLELEMPGKGEFLLFEMLHYPLYNISPALLAEIASEIGEKDRKSRSWRKYLEEEVRKAEKSEAFSPRHALIKLWQQVENWLKEAASQNVPQLVHEAISGLGFLDLALKSNEREWQLEQLHTFLNFATSTNQKNHFMTLKEFCAVLEKMKQNNIAIPLEKRIGNNEGVVLTSAHSSKGMEYNYVFLIGCEQDNWEKDHSRGLPYKLSKLFDAINGRKDKNNDDSLEERRRLFYVATTRAKKSLSISWGNHKIDAKNSNNPVSQFVIEITGSSEITEKRLPNAQLIHAETQLLQRVNPPRIEPSESPWLKNKIEQFIFTPSTLYDLLDCGLKFYFNRLVKIPSAPSAALGYGMAVHETLNKVVKLGTLQKAWPEEKEFLQIFEQELYNRRGAFSENSFSIKLAQGREVLTEYYKVRLPIWKENEVVTTEKWIETDLNGVVIGGKTDKLIFNGNNVIVVDYKTGNPQNAQKSFNRPSSKSLAENKLPPKYWFQLGLYTLIVSKQTGKNWVGSMAIIDSVDKDTKGDFPVLKQTYNSEDYELLTALLEEGNQKLKKLEFLTGCGKKECEWCQFSKSSGQAVPDLPKDEEL